MPAKTDLSKLNCSLAKALAAVGDWWSLLIVRDVFFGAERYTDLHRSLGLSRNILADRLRHLVGEDVLVRSGTPRRPRYLLTEKGRGLATALLALLQWGDAWCTSGRSPVLVTDDAGRAIPPIRLLGKTGRPLAPARLRFEPGPGANARTRYFFEAVAKRRRA